MKKQTLIISIVSVLIISLIVILVLVNNNSGTKGSIETSRDAKNMLKSIFKENENDLPNSLETTEINVSNIEEVSAFAGLKSNSDVEFLVVSEPMMSSQAFSTVVVKAKDGADIESMKQEMLDNINMRRWICVSAEKVYITNSGNIIFMAMASEEWAKPVYDSFKEKVENKIGKELEKSEDTDYELPPEMTGDPVVDGTDFVVPPVVDGIDVDGVDVPTEVSGDSISQGPIAIMVQ